MPRHIIDSGIQFINAINTSGVPLTISGVSGQSSNLLRTINGADGSVLTSLRSNGYVGSKGLKITNDSNADIITLSLYNNYGLMVDCYGGQTFFSNSNGTIVTLGGYIGGTTNGYFALGATTLNNSVNAGQDTIFYRDAAGIFAQRNGVNSQTFRVYNTYSTTGNFERGKIGWNNNAFEIGTEQGTTGGVARDLRFLTSGSGRMTITSGGNVGIGTINPTANLDVDGSVKIASARNNQFPLSIYGGNSSAQACHIILYNNVPVGVIKAGGNGTVGQGFANSSYNYQLFVRWSDGNVGINTTSPNYTLDVNGSGIFQSGLSVSGQIITNQRPLINGTPVLLSGEGGGATPANLVYTTGTQTIAGEKTFSNKANFYSGFSVGNNYLNADFNSFEIFDDPNFLTVMKYAENTEFYFEGPSGAKVDVWNSNVSNFDKISSNLISGTNLSLESGIKFNGGISNKSFEIYKDDKTYNFSMGPTGTWGAFGSTLISLTSGGPNISNNFTPSFKLIDQSNSQFFEIGGYSDDEQYGSFSTFRMGSEGLGYWSAGGGIFAVRGTNVGIGTAYPGHKLDVDGNINATSFSSSGNAGMTTSVSVIDNSNNVITLNFENGLLISIT
jgi:hypothetical protein